VGDGGNHAKLVKQAWRNMEIEVLREGKKFKDTAMKPSVPPLGLGLTS